MDVNSADKVYWNRAKLDQTFLGYHCWQSLMQDSSIL